LKNRIEIIKREEQDYKNQLKNIKKREVREQKIHIDKMKIKFQLTKIKEEQDKELRTKRERIQQFKEKTKFNLEEKKFETIYKKKRKYQSALNDKHLIRCIIEQINNQQINKKNFQHEKVKQYYNESETNKMKRNIMKENEQRLLFRNNLKNLLQKEKIMKKKLDDLLSIEKKYLDQLNQTRESNLRYMENTSETISKYSYSNYIKKGKKKLNKSVEIESKKGNDSKLGLSISVRNIKSKNYKKDYITEHTQSSSRNIFKVNRNKSIDKISINNAKNNKNNNNKNNNIKNIKNKNIKNRNKESDFKTYKKINKSVVNIKETNKNIKNIKNIKNASIDKNRVRNKHQSYLNFLEKNNNKSAIKSTKKKK